MEAENKYRNKVARGIAATSGIVVMGILWFGDLSVSIFNFPFEFLLNKMNTNNVSHSHVTPQLTRRIQWVKKIAKLVEGIATAILSSVGMLTGFVGSLIFNSKPAKKLISFVPPEIVDATLNAFGEIGKAVEEVRKKVVSTLTGGTTKVVTKRYGENAGRATDQVMEAATHTIGAASAFSNIPNAFNPNKLNYAESLANAAHDTIHNKKI